MFRTVAILNTVPGSNINIKEIIGIYEYYSLARSLFDVSGLPNYCDDEKSYLVHAACNFIDDAWIDPWQDKLDGVVIDAMSAIFHRPNSSLKAFKCSHLINVPIYKSHC